MNNSRYKTWEKVFAVVIITILIIVAVVFLYYYLWFKIEVNKLKNSHKTNMEIELQNRDDNTKIFNEYIKNAYGIVSDAFEIEIKPAVVNYNTIFVIKSEFMDKTFGISVDTDKKVVSDNFYEVLSTDSKFQHLYSEWIKKQIGIDDDNVEFQFAGNFDNPYIEFDKITSLSEDYREIFENTHNLYAWLCEVRNINYLTYENKYEIAEQVRDNYLLKAMKITGIPKDERDFFGGHIDLSNGNFDLDKNIKYTYVFDARNSSELIEKTY